MENPACGDLNYDDTEEPLSQEGIDKCHLFDMDIEQQPLYQPRESIGVNSSMPMMKRSGKNQKNMDNAFDFTQEEVRLTCPDSVRAQLQKQFQNSQ